MTSINVHSLFEEKVIDCWFCFVLFCRIDVSGGHTLRNLYAGVVSLQVLCSSFHFLVLLMSSLKYKFRFSSDLKRTKLVFVSPQTFLILGK